MTPIDRNLSRVRGEISGILERLGRPPESVKLLAVSKTFPVAVLEQAVRAGQRCFGENRIQEAEEKVPHFPDLQWHLIGPIQSNKARRAVETFDVVQTLDRAKIIDRVGRFAGELDKELEVFLQVNVGAEDQKHGCRVEEAADLAVRIDSFPGLRLQGLMCIPPYHPDPEAGRRYYARMRELRDEINQTRESPLVQLSMGMSHDFAVAIEEGSTLVRVGTAIFGRR